LSIKTKLSIIFSIVVSCILILNNTLNYFSTKDLLEEDQKLQMNLLAKEIKIAIEHADMGSKYIEDLIGEKLRLAALYAQSELDPKVENVSNDHLIEISKTLGISHITLFVKQEDDIVAVKSSDPSQIGMGTKGWGYWFQAFQQLFNHREVTIPEGQRLANYWSGPFDVAISDPGSIDKWGYYYDGTTDYIIDPYVKNDKAYQGFVEKVSAGSIVEKILVEESSVILDITGFNPKAYGKDPIYTEDNGQKIIELQNQPLFFGANKYGLIEKDSEFVAKAHESGQSVDYEATIEGKKVIKNFVPIPEAERPYVIGLVTDYNAIQDVLNKQLLSNVLISLILLVIVFCGSYFLAGYVVRPIKHILKRVDEISEGNFGLRISLTRKDELGVLAERVNLMSDNLASYTQQLKDKNNEIKHMAYHDSLTGLANRRLLEEVFSEAMEKAKEKKLNLSVLFFDLDRFKSVNDMFGHTVGDLLLKEVARRLERCFAEKDIIARFGGDEFIVVVTDTNRDHTVRTVTGLIKELAAAYVLEGHEVYITPSIGISMYPADGDNVESLIKSADIALFRAKEAGKNTYRFFSSEMDNLAQRRIMLEKDLRKALMRGELEIFYQPQIHLEQRKIVGMEALLRWRHPELGLISPAEFIPLAEESGLINPIGEWVIRQACIQNKKWQESGLPSMRVSVNLSANQFHQQQFVEGIKQILDETGLEAQYLELEITESIAMNNVDYVISKLRSLKNLGIKIAIDDFGTGYSSLSYLQKFSIDTLKIDKSFVSDLGNSGVITIIISVAKNLKLNVIAEGVETMEQIQFLKQRSCDEAQGYYFSKPLPPNMIEEVYKSLQESAAALEEE
jgi:diguanylate cyclase (GGDEF)-like protein